MQGPVSTVANKGTLKGNWLKEQVVTEGVVPPSCLSQGCTLDERREIIGLGTVNQEKTLTDSLFLRDMEELVQKMDSRAHDPRARKYMLPWRIKPQSRTPKLHPLFDIRGTKESHFRLRRAGHMLHHQTRINTQDGGLTCRH